MNAITQLDPDTPEGEEPEEIVVGYTVTYILNGQTFTVQLDADASVARGGVSIRFNNGQAAGFSSLRRFTASQISGMTARSSDGPVDIASNAAVYVKMGDGYYQTTLASVSDTTQYTLSCYYDGSSTSKRVRIIVAEEK